MNSTNCTLLRCWPVRIASFFVLLLALLAGCVVPGQSVTEAVDWRRDWAVADGFTLSKDATGFSLPSAIAFVPEPGPAPDDPLYFVSELRGVVKIVANDRTVRTFAENSYLFTPEVELPSGRGQGGQGGICLDPVHGFVFVTFLYEDSSGVLRNGIVRYTTRPGNFSGQPTALLDLSPNLASYESGLAHHIGPCQVVGDTLFVGVGEAWQPHLAQDPNEMVGKILRMSLNGQPLPDNPFYVNDDTTRIANYVWAVGLRNPYALHAVDGRLFVGDNGVGIDRFIEVERGANYRWDGRDATIAMNAKFVWSPSLGPAGMSFYPPGTNTLGPELDNSFLIAMAGAANRGKAPGIYQVKYDFMADAITEVPSYLVRYRSRTPQMVVGIALGHDGLYFAPLYPDATGESAIVKLTHDARNAYPYKLTQSDDPTVLLREKGCLGCHSIGTDGGFGGAAGPPLDRASLIARAEQRFASPAYITSLRELDTLEQEPWVSTREARAEVLAATGEEQLRRYLINRIMEPRFDNRGSQMPNLGVSRQEAELLATYLLRNDAQTAGPHSLIVSTLRSLRFWFGVGVGFVAALASGGAVWLTMRRRHSMHRRPRV